MFQGNKNLDLNLGDIVLSSTISKYQISNFSQTAYNQLMANTSLDPGGVLGYTLHWAQYIDLSISGTITCRSRMMATSPPSLFCPNNTSLDIDECCQLERNIQSNYKNVIKLLKYFVRSPGREMTRAAEANDYRTFKSGMMASSFAWRDDDSLPFIRDPVIAACKYGSRVHMTPYCNLFRTTYSTKGLAHTFNSLPFLDTYKKTERNMAFFEEFVRNTDSAGDHGRGLHKVEIRQVI